MSIIQGSQKTRARNTRSSTKVSSVKVLNVSIDNLSMRELLVQLRHGFVLTPNVDHLIRLQHDSEFYHIYTQADYRVCDSQILMYAAWLLGSPLCEKISGSDLFPAFCNYHRKNSDITVFLLGGAPGVAEQARSKVNVRTGREIIVAAHSPSFGFETKEQECLEIIDLINKSEATVLAIGVGAPKQEKWIYKHKHLLTSVKIFLAIGATIDFEAGLVERAPKWVSKIGMEWLFRISKDPKRLWKRYLVDDIPFLWLLLKQILGIYHSPFTKVSMQSTRAKSLDG